MSDRHLVMISLGPVQDFIAAARRTADLWAGSQLLSAVTRAAACSLVDSGATLVYPLEESVRKEGDVPNVVVAAWDGDADRLQSICHTAKEHARAELTRYGEEVLAQWPELAKDRVRAQMADALDVYSAWCSLDCGFGPAFRNLGRVMAARKASRTFGPHLVGDRLPKNSLDGLRETVQPERPSPKLLKQLSLTSGERLDALGVVKRHVGRRESFAALTRVAVQDWLEVLTPEELEALCAVYEPLVALDVARRTKAPQFAAFPYDAALMFSSRLQTATNENPDAGPQLHALRQMLTILWKKYGQPLPYVALLMADGNSMGRYLQRLAEASDGMDLHGRLSRGLVSFANEARTLVAEQGGQVLYAGGDDVMAMVPVSRVLDVSRGLSGAFDKHLTGLPDNDSKPTLRVGAAIAHMVEPLGTIRTWAHEEESGAKTADQQRPNALSLVVHQRGGGTLRTRFQLDQSGPFEAMSEWVHAYRERRMPSRLGFRVRDIAERGKRQRLGQGVMDAEFRLLLVRQQEGKGDGSLGDELVARMERRLGEVKDLRQLGTELILARWLSARVAGDLARGEN